MTWRTYEEIKKYMLCFVLGAALGFAGGFLCFRENVPGDGDGIGRAREQLSEATESERRTEETESVRLSEQLTGLRKTATEQEALLEKANQSLAEYAKEEKKEKERLRLQRDLGWGVAILAAAAYIKK